MSKHSLPFTNYKHKYALITGAANGIGRSTAILFAQLGCNLYLLDRNSIKVKKLGVDLEKKYSVKVVPFVCDITNSQELKQIKNKIKPLDYLINVAGTSIKQRKGEINEQIFDQLINTNLKSVYLTSMIFGYGALKKGGAIVNVSSIRARTGTPSFSPGYAAAKAGVINLTKSMALEFSEKGIRANAVAPGPTYPTKLSKNWNKDMIKNLKQTIPLRRLAKPNDIANAILFLTSDLASYITGHTLDVNGGLWMN